MFDWFWIIPALPLAGFLVLTLGPSLSRATVSGLTLATSTLAAVLSASFAIVFLQQGLHPFGHTRVLWTWMDIEGFTPRIALYVDALSMTMVLIITGVGVLVQLYATEYMSDDPDYQRFFAYMSLFVGAMLVLVLADNFLLLFLGWEGVGLCSYLLIGFWYRDPLNGRAARKAFIVNRIGDAAMLVGLCLLFTELGTLEIQAILRKATLQWTISDPLAVAATALLLGGAVGKSAQVPLQVWLPDAMAGPTPVSALIHSATMVTAGVYLIARTHTLFALAPATQTAIVVIGTITMLFAASSALVQRDIKRVFAYSTISQLGYMFIALGVGAAGAGIFHLFTHACFKALLFLVAGALMFSLHHEKDLMKMGGLRQDLPLLFWVAVIGAASLSGLPFITAGFFSKDQILLQAWISPHGGRWLLTAGLIGSVLTALYSFRVVFLAFFGDKHKEVSSSPGWRMTVPMVVLAALSLGVGWLGWSPQAEEPSWFIRLMDTAMPVHQPNPVTETQASMIAFLASSAALLGVGWAYLMYMQRPASLEAAGKTETVQAIRQFLLRGWAFNWMYRWTIQKPFRFLARAAKHDLVERTYDRLLVRPFLSTASSAKGDIVDQAYERLLMRPFQRVADINQDDVLDRVYRGLTWLVEQAAVTARRLQTGQVRWYATVLAAGALGLAGLAVLT
ncbi:MAG: NADH-quinone oxidoreductase subunit L [Nitrospira sp. WS110]|nr:NADH-quinone oxidoreductase subunit L [Nitrospira sp. WS110]